MTRPPTNLDRNPSSGRVGEGQAHQLFSQGLALHRQGRLNDAAAYYQRALTNWPKHFPALHMLGVVQTQNKHYDSAIGFFDRAIEINPRVAEAFSNRGIALQKRERFHDAIASYEKAIALKPDIVEAHSNRGIALKELKRFDEAVASYDRAIALKPNVAQAHLNRGIVLHELKRFEEAIASYEKALRLEPDLDLLPGVLLQAKMQVCDWTGFAKLLAQYERDILSSKLVTEPFAVLPLVDSPALQKKAAEIYVAAKYPQDASADSHGRHSKNERIRIGYFSADLRNHAVSHCVAEIFECHDPSRFDVIGFYFGPLTDDEMHKRIAAAFHQFHYVQDKTDTDLARYARELKLDIAVDLMGHTKNSRMGIFAKRCAPIQLNYLGYPATTGANYIDYVLADATVLPKNRQHEFTEKVVYLPASYLANDSKRQIAQKILTREECGLPASGFVFCCFNSNSKILPATFDVWMRMLHAVKDSVLWLLEDNPTAAENLAKEAENRGILRSRLVFAGRTTMDEHLARHRLADLFLDTLPYNAHTTASDALWAGLPVLTCMGHSLVSRVAASLLKAVELPELIAQDQAEYESLAIALATNPERLSAIRRTLAHNKLTTPIFNTRLFTKHLEAAYEAMYDKDQAGEPPGSIELD